MGVNRFEQVLPRQLEVYQVSGWGFAGLTPTSPAIKTIERCVIRVVLVVAGPPPFRVHWSPGPSVQAYLILISTCALLEFFWKTIFSQFLLRNFNTIFKKLTTDITISFKLFSRNTTIWLRLQYTVSHSETILELWLLEQIGILVTFYHSNWNLNLTIRKHYFYIIFSVFNTFLITFQNRREGIFQIDK